MENDQMNGTDFLIRLDLSVMSRRVLTHPVRSSG